MTNQQAPSDESELLPCPFCGKTDGLTIDNITDETDYTVECENCQLAQHAVHTRESAIRQWNKRATKNDKAPSATVDVDYVATELWKQYIVSFDQFKKALKQALHSQHPSATVDESELSRLLSLQYPTRQNMRDIIAMQQALLHSQQEKRYTREFVIKLLLSVDDIDAKSIISDERTAGIFLDQFDSEGK